MKKSPFSESKRGMRALRAIEKYWIIYFCCFCYHMCIHKSTLMSNIKAKQADIKSRAPFSRHFWNAASQERLFRNGCRNTQNGYLSNTKGSKGEYVQEGGHILRSLNKVGHSRCYPCWKCGQLRGGGEIKIGVWSDCDGDRRFAKWVCEVNGGRFKQETPSKP